MRIDTSRSAVQINVGETRKRTTVPVPKGTGIEQGLDFVLRGAEVGASLVGGPILGAAVRAVRGAGIVPGGPLSGMTGSQTGAEGTAESTSEGATIDELRARQNDAQALNMEYLELQEQVQAENRRFTTLSNVLQARHDTAKAAINNIRS